MSPASGAVLAAGRARSAPERDPAVAGIPRVPQARPTVQSGSTTIHSAGPRISCVGRCIARAISRIVGGVAAVPCLYRPLTAVRVSHRVIRVYRGVTAVTAGVSSERSVPPNTVVVQPIAWDL